MLRRSNRFVKRLDQDLVRVVIIVRLTPSISHPLRSDCLALTKCLFKFCSKLTQPSCCIILGSHKRIANWRLSAVSGEQLLCQCTRSDC